MGQTKRWKDYLNSRPSKKQKKSRYFFSDDPQLPVFVYGTLRKNCGNYQWCLAGATVKELPATTKGVMLNVGAFPGVIEGDRVVHGELMWIKPEYWYSVLAELDSLEGYNPYFPAHSMYTRKIVDVTTAKGVFKAYIYIWNSSRPLPIIPSGDWLSTCGG